MPTTYMPTASTLTTRPLSLSFYLSLTHARRHKDTEGKREREDDEIITTMSTTYNYNNAIHPHHTASLFLSLSHAHRDTETQRERERERERERASSTQPSMASRLSHSPPSQLLAPLLLLQLLLLPLLPPSAATSIPTTGSSSSRTAPSSSSAAAGTILCNSTPYPDTCLQSLKLSLGIPVGLPDVHPYLLQALHSAILEADKLSALLATAAIVETQRGTLQDCRELHHITVASLAKSASLVQSGTPDRRRLSHVRTYLSAALTNRATCLEGLSVASGPLKDTLVGAVVACYKFVTVCLSIASKTPRSAPAGNGRRLLTSGGGGGGSGGFPSWLSRRDRRLLQGENGYDPASVLTVAADGTGNFTTVSAAVDFAPSNSADRTIIIVRAGVYEEYVVIPSYKTNIVLLGDGSDVTVIRGGRSVGDGWTTFRSATVAVSGEGFLARDIAFDNTAGPAKGQAVALRVNADLVAFYHCSMRGHQDTLYAHTFRQFYRECVVSGTVDFIFGNAAVAFQGCTILPRRPLPGQSNAVAAQGRDDPNMNTGMSIQNCTVVASGELAAGTGGTRTYLGRPWKPYARTVYMKTYMGEVVDAAGWAEWDGEQGLDTLYYGEYANEGPGAVTENRVAWPGYHVMRYDEAVMFTVDELIDGYGWLESTSFPYDDGV